MGTRLWWPGNDQEVKNESSKNGPWLSYKEDDSIGSECCFDGKVLPEDRPELSRSEIEGLFSPPQRRVGSEEVHIKSVPRENRTPDFHTTSEPSICEFMWKPNVKPEDFEKCSR